MTALDFKNNWTNLSAPLTPICNARLERFSLQKATYNFLNIAGLPIYCEPNLSFVNNTDNTFEGINRLTNQFDFLETKSDFEKYITIGFCRDGNFIAIDTSDDDKIVELDHEDLFAASFFNSTIEAMADFLILYRDFETEVLQNKPLDDKFQIFNFTDSQFEILKSKMYSLDSNALTEKGFWEEELEIMLSIRSEHFPNR